MEERQQATGNRQPELSSAVYPAADCRMPDAEPTIVLTATAARRIRDAFAKAEAVLRRAERVRALPISGAAREARSEIGAAVAHLDRAAPPTDALVIVGIGQPATGTRVPAAGRRMPDAEPAETSHGHR